MLFTCYSPLIAWANTDNMAGTSRSQAALATLNNVILGICFILFLPWAIYFFM